MVRKRLELVFLLVFCAAALWLGFYTMIYRPYVVLRREDQQFLQTNPTKEAVIERFGRPAEVLGAGERFSMTGWRPLPEQAATHSASFFVRRYGGKIYILFDHEGRVEHWVLSNS